MSHRLYDYDEFRRLYDAGCNDAEIARQAGCCHQTVYSWRIKCGLPTHLPSRRGLKKAVEGLVARGVSMPDIARQLNCGQAYVRATLQRLKNPQRASAYSREYYAEHRRLIGR